MRALGSHFRSLILFALILILGGGVYRQLVRAPNVTPPRSILPKDQKDQIASHHSISAVTHESSYKEDTAPISEQLSSRPSSPIDSETETRSQLHILNEILKSKNDNDPRIDRELTQLSNETKQAFMREYQDTARELRNNRGMIVFLLGRNMTGANDFNFMKSVVSEPPCLSMQNCSKVGLEDPHSDSSSSLEVTLAYPQMVALKSIETYLRQTGNSARAPYFREAMEVLKNAQKSGDRITRDLASKILSAASHG